jgi:transposase-like protein
MVTIPLLYKVDSISSKTLTGCITQCASPTSTIYTDKLSFYAHLGIVGYELFE